MSVSKDIFRYLSRPHFFEEKETLSFGTIPTLSRIMGLKLLLTLAVYFLIAWVTTTVDINEPARTSHLAREFDISRFLKIAIFLPFMEELIFRSWLRKKWGVFYVFPLISLFAIWFLCDKLEIKFSLVIFGGAGLILLLNAAIISNLQKKIGSDGLVQILFPYIFWIVTVLFALLHLTNYKTPEVEPLSFLFVLPQFIGGAFYGYIVMRFGFLSAFGYHALWNGSLAIIAITMT